MYCSTACVYTATMIRYFGHDLPLRESGDGSYGMRDNSPALSLSLFLQCNTYTHMHTMLDEERVSRLCAAIVDRRLSRRLSRARGRGKVAAAGCDGECALFSADFIGTQHTCCRKLVRARICVCVVIGRRRVCVCRSCTG